jgi:hypothetical protein
MLNLKMTAKAMPHADDVDARREEFEAFTARAVAQAVKAIGQGLDVRSDVLIAASYAIATQPLRNVISAQAFDKSTKATTTKEIKSAILVGLVLDGRPVFKGLPVTRMTRPSWPPWFVNPRIPGCLRKPFPSLPKRLVSQPIRLSPRLSRKR